MKVERKRRIVKGKLRYKTPVYTFFRGSEFPSLYFGEDYETVFCYQGEKLAAIAFTEKNPDPSRCRIDIVCVEENDEYSGPIECLKEECYRLLETSDSPVTIAIFNHKHCSDHLH